MTQDELTPGEKGKLLAHKDIRHLNDYDKAFYKLLMNSDIPELEDLDQRIRLAIFKFVSDYYENVMMPRFEYTSPNEYNIGAALTILLLTGYELGRKLRRPLPSNQSTPR